MIYGECLDGLPVERNAMLDNWRQERLLASDDAPWLTFKKAKLELDSLLAKSEEAHRELIEEIAQFYAFEPASTASQPI